MQSWRIPARGDHCTAMRSWKEPEGGALDSVSQCGYLSSGRTEPGGGAAGLFGNNAVKGSPCG